jgi:hypothetical protein
VSVPNQGRRNRLFGWSLFLVGILGGWYLGLWVFNGPLPAPPGLADYGSLPRRLIRFAHIACMALGLTNVLYGHELERVALTDGARRFGSWCMITAGALMPVLLTLTAFQNFWKWGLTVPSSAAFVAVAILVRGLAAKEAR